MIDIIYEYFHDQLFSCRLMQFQLYVNFEHACVLEVNMHVSFSLAAVVLQIGERGGCLLALVTTGFAACYKHFNSGKYTRCYNCMK